MRNDYRVLVATKAGGTVTDGKFPKPWYAERVYELTQIKRGHTITLMRWSRRGWKILRERARK